MIIVNSARQLAKLTYLRWMGDRISQVIAWVAYGVVE
jgi:hypothetical protein